MELEIVRRLTDEISKKRETFKSLKDSGMTEEAERVYQELSTLEAKLQMARTALTRAIAECVPEGKQKAILIYRYINLEKYSSIATAMSLSERYIYKLRKAGVKSYEAGRGG